uniref:Large ribosomal subunit protein mL51 n=1 Tax=Salmo salar TaxID=8030 RepID=B5X8R8_SALSA|nr:39S ribosomal protein L51, mitochondrial precursor [Salmo salar]ADM15915.1 39S ribosomal protein L51, mitochondrial precursor [Salmo salar]
MSLLRGLLKAGVSLCHSTLQTTRQISTGVCCPVRMNAIPELKKVDRWTEKRSMFGVYDNELQRLTRKKRMVGDRMMTQDKHDMEKRIRFLYRHFNRFGKHR